MMKAEEKPKRLVLEDCAANTVKEYYDADEADKFFIPKDLVFDCSIRTCFGLTMEEIQERIRYWDENHPKEKDQ